MQVVRNIDEVFTGHHVDCYVSTDIAEVEDVLYGLGYQNAPAKQDGLICQYEPYLPASFSVAHTTTRLPIEGVDIPVEEALERRKIFEFTPMSKFRMYLNGNRSLRNETVRIIKSLDTERQNMAFVDDSYQFAFVKLSEFYK